MTRCVALLRGVNVGGHRRVRMADLRALLTDLGHEDVETYLQSGNAVFTNARPTDDVARELTDALATTLDVHCAVLVRTAEELAATVAGNPWPELVDDPTLLHVAFLSDHPDRAWVDALDPAAYEPERVAVGDRVLYLYVAGGQRRSRLPTDERRLGVVATARNWRTVTELARRADPPTAG